MSQASPPIHRPDLTRSIKIHGALDSGLAQYTLKEVTHLASQSDAAITFDIDSQGGALHALMKLERIFYPPQNNKKLPLIVAVASAEVKSAAAYLLVMGHFAYIKPTGQLVFHGARYRHIHKLKTVSSEDALAMAVLLNVQNRRIAGMMAEAMVYRTIHRFCVYYKKLGGNVPKRKTETRDQIDNFFNYLYKKLSSDECKNVLEDALECAELIDSLAEHLPTKSRKHQAGAKAEARILNAATTIKIKNLSGENQSLDEVITAELMMDYLFLRDLMDAKHVTKLQNLTTIFGREMLTPSEKTTYERKKARKPANAEKYLSTTVEPKLQRLWHFTLALCRRLLIRENTVSATDAYWLGLVDEVQGTSLSWRPLANEERRRH